MKKLETKDYKLVKVKDKQYVFLTGSQEVLEIQNPLLEEYFDSTCSWNENATHEEKFDKLTSADVDIQYDSCLQHGLSILFCFYEGKAY